jgi:hypothetical protein
MSNRKQAKPKQARKSAAKAQRAHQAVVRSPKSSRSVAPRSSESAAASQHTAPVTLPVVEAPGIASEHKSETMMKDNKDQAKPVAAPEARPVAVVQAVQLAFECAHRLGRVRSPFEVPGVLAEIAMKQLTMFRSFVLPG